MPNRVIKESIRGSEDLASVSAEAERLFWRLVVSVDDFGRFDARPKTIIGQCLTAFLGAISADQVNAWLVELEQAGLLQLYTVEGRPYLALTKWSKHQRVRAKDSKFPSPDDSCGHPLTDDSNCGHPLTSASSYVNEDENENVNVNENEDENGTQLPLSSSSSRTSLFSLCQLYERSGFGAITQIVEEKIDDLEREYGGQWVEDAFKEAVEANKRSLKYVRGILQNWKREGRDKRLADVKMRVQARASPKIDTDFLTRFAISDEGV